MNFTFHQLRIFIEVSKYESMTKAAEELYLTQPAISMQLKNFQSQFSFPIFEKIGKRIYITDFGKEIVKISENILKEAELITYKTKEYEGMLTGRLSISSASTGKYVIPYFLSEFYSMYPGIDLQLDVSNKTRVMENIINNEVDFAFVSTITEELKLEEEILLENRLYYVCNEPKPSEKPLIYREYGSATRNAMEEFMGNPQTRKAIVLTSNEAVKQAVMSGLGNSLLPLIGIKNEILNQQLFIIPNKNLPIITFWRLIWLEGKNLSPVASAYLNFIKQEKNNIIEQHFNWYINIDLE